MSSPEQAPILPAGLVAAAEVDVADRALVIGRNVIEQVAALVQVGVRSVLSLRAGSPYPRDEAPDVVWLAGLDDDVSDRLASALQGAAIPRIVVIETADVEADGRLRPMFRHLRDKGFVRFSAYRTAQGIALVAARPAWLQQVIQP